MTTALALLCLFLLLVIYGLYRILEALASAAIDIITGQTR
jgi:hypothetical protein